MLNPRHHEPDPRMDGPHHRVFALLFVLFLLPAMACNAFSRRSDAPDSGQNAGRSTADAGRGSLELGPAVELLSAPVGPQGATLIVDDPGGAEDGLAIVIPPGAFDSSVQVSVTARPITGHTFGADFNPAGDLLSIDAGPDLADELIELALPAEIGDDQYGMAFAYDASAGSLQGVLPVTVGFDGVRAVTRDLSRDFIVSTVGIERLQDDILTGFEHGVDDWEFVNYGSVLSPAGHCAGQSLSAMYYYIEQLGPALYGRYDNYDHPYPDTPNLMWDDELAYRLASMAQETIDWGSAGQKFWAAFGGIAGDEAVYNAFAYSMLLTGAPQLAGIYGEDEQGQIAGHALIVYGKQGDSFLVSDPNYPYGSEGGNGPRYITYDPLSASFDPYYSGANAEDLGFAFSDIFFFGYKDLIDWDKLGELWGELEDGTVGAEAFPAYELAVRDGDSEFEDELWWNYEAQSEQITVRVRDASFDPRLVIYDANGSRISLSTEPVTLPLAEGDNFFGLRVDAGTASGRFKWVGFDWVKIVYHPDTARVEEPASQGLCGLLPPGGTITHDDAVQCAKNYPGMEIPAYIVLLYDEQATAAEYCQSLTDGNFGWYYMVDLYLGHECGYRVIDTDYGTQNTRLGSGWWIYFADENYSVKVHSGATEGEYTLYPENEEWVMDTVGYMEQSIRDRLGQGR